MTLKIEGFQPYDAIFKPLPIQHLDKTEISKTLCNSSCKVIKRGKVNYGKSFSFKSTNEISKVLIILEQPITDNPDNYWTTQQGKFLLTLINQHQLEGVSVVVSYLTKCFSQEKKFDVKFKLDMLDIQYCSSNILEEINTINPTLIVLMGTLVTKSFFGNVSLFKHRGKIHDLDIKGTSRKIICTLSPSFVEMQPHQGSVVRVDLAKAFFWAKIGFDTYKIYSKRSNIVVYESTDKGIDDFEEKITSMISSDNPIYVAWDTETESLSKFKNKLYSFGFSDNPSYGYAINYEHPRSIWNKSQLIRISNSIHKLVISNKCILISHNTQFDLSIINITLNFNVINNKFDTLAMAHALEEDFSSKEYSEGCYPKYMPVWKSLEIQSKHWLDFSDQGWSDMKKFRSTLAALDTDVVDAYAAMDCCNTLRIFYVLSTSLYSKQPSTYESIVKIMTPVNNVLSTLERNGLPIDWELLKSHLEPDNENSATYKLNQLRKKFLALPNVIKLNDNLTKGMVKPPLFGGYVYVNPSSSAHMKILFYDIFGHEPEKEWSHEDKAEIPVYSTDREFLEKIIKGELRGHIEATALLELRQFEKLVSTFITGFYVSASLYPDKRVRSSYNGAKTVTHRLSSAKPNLQQIPRSGEKSNVAKGFVKKLIKASKGKVLISADYGTVEIRGAAIASHDKVLAEIFNNAFILKRKFLKNPTVETYKKFKFEGDAHRANAAISFNKTLETVTKDERQDAKSVSFLCVYAENPAPQLALDINCTLERAKEIIDTFLGKLEGLNNYLKSRDVLAYNFGLVKSFLGRSRSLYAAMFPINKKEFKHAINQARNNGIQGGSSDFLILAANNIVTHINENNLDWKLCNVVHDSILMEIPIEDLKLALDKITYFLENPGLENFNIDPTFCKLDSDFEIGLNYGHTVSFDGTDNHFDRIHNWIKNGGNENEKPESYFTEYLDLNGKYESIKSFTDDKSKEVGLDLKNNLDELTKLIDINYPKKVTTC